MAEMSRCMQIRLEQQASQCMLCYDAPCTAACDAGADPAAMVRSIRFENLSGAAESMKAADCAACAHGCESACSKKIPLAEMAAALPKSTASKPADLSISFCGVPCINPFFLSSSVVASSYEMCARALEQGWGGIVFKTIGFYQPKEVSPRFDTVSREGYPFLGFRNLEQISDHTLEENLACLRRLKQNYPDRVIVASIMGETEDEWTKLAQMATDAGCDIIECNFSCPQMTVEGMGSDVGTNVQLVKAFTAAVKRGTALPVLAKMTPNITDMTVPAIAAAEAGADGLAAINTIKSITGIDEETMQAHPGVMGKTAVSGYSGKAVKPIALRHIYDMATCPELKDIPISGMGGIETWRDAVQFLALGCSNIQITTAVMQYGYRIITDLIGGLTDYMNRHGITALQEIVGAGLDAVTTPEKLNRSSVCYPKFLRQDCSGCGRCYISCMDAGHQAIRFDTAARRPVLIGKNCVGCLLCTLVCPTGAITSGARCSVNGEKG